MINRIIDLSVQYKFVVFAVLLAACVVGWWSMTHVPVDVLPDLSDTQVIIYSRWDRSPDVLEDQVTYPIVTAMLGAPKVKTVRGFSDFGYSYVYVIFEDGTDIYWARSRTLEYLSGTLATLPQGVKTELGPDATGLGWIFQYVLTDSSGAHSLADLRSYQDWRLRYYLKAVPGVAEVAPSAVSASSIKLTLIRIASRPTEFRSREWLRPFAGATAKLADGCWNSVGLNTWSAAAAMPVPSKTSRRQSYPMTTARRFG
jgi:Cu/Ag efflux pump CusA